jgi:hypothetical protein
MRAPDQAQAIAFTPDSGSIVAVTASGDLVRWPAEGGPGVTLSRLAQIPGEFSFNGIQGVGARRGRARQPDRCRRLLAPGQSSLQLVDADTSKVLQQVSANVAVGWALAQDRRVVVAAAGSIAFPSSTC